MYDDQRSDRVAARRTSARSAGRAPGHRRPARRSPARAPRPTWAGPLAPVDAVLDTTALTGVDRPQPRRHDGRGARGHAARARCTTSWPSTRSTSRSTRPGSPRAPRSAGCSPPATPGPPRWCSARCATSSSASRSCWPTARSPARRPRDQERGGVRPGQGRARLLRHARRGGRGGAAAAPRAQGRGHGGSALLAGRGGRGGGPRARRPHRARRAGVDQRRPCSCCGSKAPPPRWRRAPRGCGSCSAPRSSPTVGSAATRLRDGARSAQAVPMAQHGAGGAAAGGGPVGPARRAHPGRPGRRRAADRRAAFTAARAARLAARDGGHRGAGHRRRDGHRARGRRRRRPRARARRGRHLRAARPPGRARTCPRGARRRRRSACCAPSSPPSTPTTASVPAASTPGCDACARCLRRPPPALPRAARRLRALRVLPAHLPDLPAVGRGDGLPARADLPDEPGGEGRDRPGRPVRHAHRPLPGLHGVRDGVPVGRAVRPAAGSHPPAGGAQRRARQGRQAVPRRDLRAVPVQAAAARGRRAGWRSTRRCAGSRRSGRWPSGCRAAGGDGVAAAAGLGARRVRPPARAHPRGRDPARTGGAALRLRAGRVLPPRQRGHRAGARRRGLGRARAPRPAVLRRAGAALRPRGARAGPGPARDRRLLRPRRRLRRHQRGGLRLVDEGVRPPARRRPGVGRARGGVQRAGARRARGAGRGRAAAPRATRSRPRRLPRRLPPRARAEGAGRSRARCCAPIPGWSSSTCRRRSCAAARRASTTWSRPRPRASSARARRRTSAATRPDIVVTANPGCLLQIGKHLGVDVPLLHPVQLLDASIRGVPVPRT